MNFFLYMKQKKIVVRDTVINLPRLCKIMTSFLLSVNAEIVSLFEFCWSEISMLRQKATRFLIMK